MSETTTTRLSAGKLWLHPPEGLVVRDASTLGVQLHVGRKPRANEFPQASMETPGIGFRPLNQPWGALWTATLSEDGSSRFVDVQLERAADLTLIRDFDTSWWLLRPRQHTCVLVLDDDVSFQAAHRLFPYRDSVELDFEAVRDAGFAGVHVPEQAARECHHLRDWTHESTCWLLWRWDARPEPTSPPEWIKTFLATTAPIPRDDDGTGRTYLGGAYAGYWVRTGELSQETLATALHLLRLRDRGAQSDGEDQLILLGLAKLLVDELVVEHNLVALDGAPLPVGPGLFQALGPTAALGIVDLWAQVQMIDRDWPSGRLYPAEKLRPLQPVRRIRWRSRIMQEWQRRYDEPADDATSAKPGA